MLKSTDFHKVRQRKNQVARGAGTGRFVMNFNPY